VGRRGYPLVADVGGPGGTGTGGSRRPRCAGTAAGRPRPRPRRAGSAPRSGSRREPGTGGRGSARRGGGSSDAARRASTMRSTAGAARAQTSRLPVPGARRGSRRAPAPRSSRAAGMCTRHSLSAATTDILRRGWPSGSCCAPGRSKNLRSFVAMTGFLTARPSSSNRARQRRSATRGRRPRHDGQAPGADSTRCNAPLGQRSPARVACRHRCCSNEVSTSSSPSVVGW
jgi:hypothetical protein